MNTSLARLPLFAAVLVASCAMPMRDSAGIDSRGPIGPTNSGGPTMGPAAGSPQAERNETSALYARDGSIVTGDRTSPVALTTPGSDNAPVHDIQRTGEGRMYILELYQNVIEERDTLTLEVRGLNGELDRTRTALVEADVRIANLEAQVTTFEARLQSLEAENMDLAGRLTTAQIRRLQAEKILLEIRLEESRALDALVEAEVAAAEEE